MKALKLALLLTVVPGYVAWQQAGGLAPRRIIVTGSLPRFVLLAGLVWAIATGFLPGVAILGFALVWMGVMSYTSYRSFQHNRKASQ